MSSSRPAEAVRRVAPTTLTGRLVVVVVLLVALCGVLVATVTALAMRSYLTGQVDDQLRQAVARDADGGPGADPDDARARLCPLDAGAQPFGHGLPIGQSAGTLTVRPGCSFIVDDHTLQALSASVQLSVSRVPADGVPHTTDLPGLGSYRVVSTGSRATGLPMRAVDHAVGSLVWWELALTGAGVLLAGLGGAELVRRTLRPLRAVAATAHEVATQPLDTGDPSIRTRVPAPLTDPATEVGQVGAALNTLLDHVGAALTARHRSEEQVRQFVADASHELRTPLSTIQGYAELSRRTPEDAAALAAAMRRVEGESERMAALVEDLLLLARLDAGRPLASEPVDVTHLLLETVSDARVVAPEHRWRLELPDEPVTMTGDGARLRQVVVNLLANARVHTPAGTTVTVRARQDDGRVRVEVHDDGPGLPPGLVPRAFERFARGDSSRTRASGGTGLGLSLVAAITEALGGSVGVASVPGDTTFTVLLPRR
ncbi:MAG: sensor histidine kinase [Marmoricola sp.]